MTIFLQQGKQEHDSTTEKYARPSYAKIGDVIYLVIDGEETLIEVREDDLYFVPSQPPLSYFSTPSNYMNYQNGNMLSCNLSLISRQSVEELKKAYMILGFSLTEFIKIFSPTIEDPRENNMNTEGF